MSAAAFAIAAALLFALFVGSAALDRGTSTPHRRFDFQRHPSRRISLLLASGSMLFLLFIWFAVADARIVNPIFLPSPVSAFRALSAMITSGELWPHLLASVRRIMLAFGIATAVAFVIGALAGSFPRVASVVTPFNSSLRYIPPTAFIGLTIIWFGIGEASKLALIIIATIFYLVQMIADAVSLVPRVYIDAARTLGASRFEILRDVILQMSIPEILAALRVNLGAAWTFLVMAEIVAAQNGLGYLMSTSQRYLQTDRLFALLVVVGILGYATDTACAIAIRYSGRWK